MTDLKQGTHAVRIATIRKDDRHRSEVLIGVDHLVPDRDIVGRSAQAVGTLVEGDATLEGQQPHLLNAIGGLFACITHAFVPGEGRTARSTINWNPTHDLEMRLGERIA